jgi:uncharacterized protein YqjF (DUF2071 family)
MQWHNLLFMHWAVPANAVREYIPPALNIDTYDGMAWLGIVPFLMAGTRLRMLPPLPRLSAFPELNVRTYVSLGAKPGVWFFSLDAGNPVAVEGARDFFHLNYYNAQMRCEYDGDMIRYKSTRTHRNAPGASLAVRYRPTGPVYRSNPGTLEHWLTERYCLYAANRQGTIWRCEIHHHPWPLQPAEAESEANTMAAQIGLQLPETRPLLHYAQRLDVVGWWIERVAREN